MTEWDFTWFSILGMNTSGFKNFGNVLIERCLRRLIPINGSELRVDSFRPLEQTTIDQINRTRFLVVPGCTTIQTGHNPAMLALKQISIPIYVFGAAFKSMGNGFPSQDAVTGIGQVLGARDSFTESRLRHFGFHTSLIGCPTLWSGSRPLGSRSGPIAFSFARATDANAEKQLFLLDKLSARTEVVVLVHEDRHDDIWPRSNFRKVSLQDYDETLECLRSCSALVTGRLHSLLPAVANGVPSVFFFDKYDSRMQLVQDVGLTIMRLEPDRIVNGFDELVEGCIANERAVTARLFFLRRMFTSYISMFRQEVGV